MPKGVVTLPIRFSGGRPTPLDHVFALIKRGYSVSSLRCSVLSCGQVLLRSRGRTKVVENRRIYRSWSRHCLGLIP